MFLPRSRLLSSAPRIAPNPYTILPRYSVAGACLVLARACACLYADAFDYRTHSHKTMDSLVAGVAASVAADTRDNPWI